MQFYPLSPQSPKVNINSPLNFLSPRSNTKVGNSLFMKSTTPAQHKQATQ